MCASKSLRRREFIQVAASVAVSGSVISCAGSKSPWRFFSEEQGRTAEAICEQIIPTDQDPGAVWAGVVNYIDRQLLGPYRYLQESYRQGIAGVDETSVAMFGKRFADLPDEQQIEVLTAMEKDEAPGDTWKEHSARSFFNLMVDHTMQGFYGSPRHGGNRDYVSWEMLGVPHPPIRGRHHYDMSAPQNQEST